MDNYELGGSSNESVRILSGNAELPEPNNVAERFPPVRPETERKKGAGRKKGIGDGYLGSTRNVLVGLLQGAWGEIGLALEKVQTAADVLNVFLALKTEPNLPYIITALLRDSEEPANAKRLRLLNIRTDKLNESLSETEWTRQQSLHALEAANRVDISDLPKEQQSLVMEEQNKRKADFEAIDAEYCCLLDKRRELDETIANARAYFARAEFARFCRHGRYAFTPLNVANAMAGLPYIGYRQSVKRCRQWILESGSGGGYQIFLVIRSITNSKRGVKLTEHAGQWLRTKRKPETNALKELREKWYYLRRAIESVVKSKPHPRVLPYKVTTEYYRRLKHRTSVDLLFDEGERIIA